MKFQLSLLTFCAIIVGLQAADTEVAQTGITKEQVAKAPEVKVVQIEQPKVITEQSTKDALLKELEEEEAKTKAAPVIEKVTVTTNVVKANETIAETVKPDENSNSVPIKPADGTIKIKEIKNEAVKEGEVKVDAVKEGEVKVDAVKEGEVKVDAVKEGEVKSDLTKDITVKEEEVKEVTEKGEEIVKPGFLKKIEVRVGAILAQGVKLKLKAGVLIQNMVKWFKAQKYTPKTIKAWMATTVVGALFLAGLWKGLQGKIAIV